MVGCCYDCDGIVNVGHETHDMYIHICDEIREFWDHKMCDYDMLIVDNDDDDDDDE